MAFARTNFAQIYVQVIAGCALLALVVMFQPTHHKVVLLNRDVPTPGDDGPQPGEVAAIQGTQAGSIIAADAAESSAAAEVAAAATTATELVPLVLLKQKPQTKASHVTSDVKRFEHDMHAHNMKMRMRMKQAQLARQQKLKHDLLHII
mmetsp:Transcript_35263/g.72624  ORF Transcript_35263/g.72624 Transcript_35263/m.72624 type:complete len:149 (-) Transcript_35263:161-607(-)